MTTTDAMLAELEDLTRQLGETTEQRKDLMRRARDGGATWRSIALAVGMTDHGVRLTLGYRRDSNSPPAGGGKS